MTEIIEAELTITVNGTPRDYLSATWGADTPGGLPNSIVNLGTGTRERTGTITWAPSTALATSPFAPVGEGRWVPEEGDVIEIDATYQGATYPRFRGWITSSTFSMTDDTVTSEISDLADSPFSAQVSIPPMQGRGRGGDFVLCEALTQSGVGFLPPITDRTLAYYHTAMVGPYGGGVCQAYEANAIKKVFTKKMTAGTGGCVLTWAPPMAPRSYWIEVEYTDPRYNVKIECTRLNPVAGGTQGQMTLKLYSGGNLAMPAETIPSSAAVGISWHTSGFMFRVGAWEKYVPFPGAAVYDVFPVSVAQGFFSGAFALANLGNTAQEVSFINAHRPDRFRLSPSSALLECSRSYSSVTARHVIDEYTAANFCSLWKDEAGVYQLRSRQELLAFPQNARPNPVIVDEQVFSGQWSTGKEEAYSAVTIRTDAPDTERMRYVLVGKDGQVANAHQALWSPQTPLTFTESGTTTEFLAVPETEEWINPDTSITTEEIWAPKPEVPSSRIVGQVLTQGADGAEPTSRPATASQIQAKAVQLGPRALKITYTHTVPANSSISTQPSTQGAPPTPLLMGGRRFVFSEERTTALAPGATKATAKSLELDLGWWVTPQEAEKLAQQLASELAQPRYTFESVNILWDPAYTIGEKLTLIGTSQDEEEAWEAVCLITGAKETWEQDAPTLLLTLQVIRLKDLRSGKTYADLAAAYPRIWAIPATATYSSLYNALPAALT